MPRSLHGRTLLLTVVGIIACECVTFAILGIYRHNLLAGRARDFVSGQVEMVRTSLAHATPEQVAAELETPLRERRARRLATPRDNEPPEGDRDPRFDVDDRAVRVLPPPPNGERRGPRGREAGRDAFMGGFLEVPGPRGGPRMRLLPTLPASASWQQPDDPALSTVVTALRDEYGSDALRFTDVPELAIFVRMPSVDWWLMLPFARYASPPIPWPILIATFAAVSLMGAVVGLYSFHLSKPLRAVSDAAANYKIGQRPELPVTGPDEIRLVTRQFNAMAERLERDDAERRVMLAGLPHDLRAPLARARLRLELMDDGPDSPKPGLQRDLAEVASIADQFVAYLRGLDQDTSRFSSTALHEVVRDRGLVWRESGHDVTIESAEPCERMADADALKRAIDNLVGNAFAHGGSPVSIAGMRATIGQAPHYRIVVRDRGPGIPAAQREEALKPFTRLDVARGASGHCGLGLAVAQSIARLHDGRIELDEAPGGGLAAAIVLPVRSSSA